MCGLVISKKYKKLYYDVCEPYIHTPYPRSIGMGWDYWIEKVKLKVCPSKVCPLFGYKWIYMIKDETKKPHNEVRLFWRDSWYYSRVRPIGFEPTTSCSGGTCFILILLHLANLCVPFVNQFRTSFETYTTKITYDLVYLGTSMHFCASALQ